MTTQKHWWDHLHRVRGELSELSPTLCLAKWFQSTLHLHQGQTHSCHHPIKHRIPLEELKKNASALHNTRYKKVMRKQMLQGEAPSECRYCWESEAANHSFSDRLIKSADHWAWKHKDEAVSCPWDAEVVPRYLEVVFGHQCQLRCAYCAPDTSSSLQKEFEDHGPYPTRIPLYGREDMERVGRFPILDEKDNPYLEAFWCYFPAIYPELKVLRVTGGEPLLNQNTFRLFEFIKKHPREDLEFSLNTNAVVSDDLFQKATLAMKKLPLKKKDLYVSVDTAGRQAEYIRYGLDYKKFLSHVSSYLEQTEGSVTIMTAFSLFSLSNFQTLLEDVLKLKKKFGPYRVFIDISWVCHPFYLSPTLMDEEMKKELRRLVVWMQDHSQEKMGEFGFIDYEFHKFERLEALVDESHSSESELEGWRRDFVSFVQEYDKRKGLSFEECFPEFISFYRSRLS